MAGSYRSTISDVNNGEYVSGTVTVGTTAVEAKVGASALTDREMLHIYNSSSSIIYIGPSSVTTSTGIPLEKKQWISIPHGPDNPVYMIRASGSETVIVQESS